MRTLIKKNVSALILIGVFGLGCTTQVKEGQEDLSILEKDSVNVFNIDSNYNVVHESTLQPYAQVDSLFRLLQYGFDEDVLLKLERMCDDSDGDLSEKFYVVGRNLLNDYLADYITYLSAHKTSCLRERTILDLSAEIAMYEKDERIKVIREKKEESLEVARREKLSVDLIKVIHDIYGEVKPELFD